MLRFVGHVTYGQSQPGVFMLAILLVPVVLLLL
jgi:hypothetical protein